MAMLYFAYRNRQKVALSENGSSIMEEPGRKLS